MRLLTLILALVAPALLASTPFRPPVEGLDHVPVAVRDLDKATADFSRLGFVIKPGRAHDDGIRNMHVKFPNGGGIELITASAPTDALAREYVEWLKDGDGPAFWSLYSPDLASMTTVLADREFHPRNEGDLVTFAQSVFPHRVFFGDRLRSPTDSPKYWTHPNTAYRLAAVWLAGTGADKRILPVLEARREEPTRCSPFGRAIAYRLPGEGDEVMVSPDVRRSQERSIVGVTVLVQDLAAARKVLDANHVVYRQPKGCGDQSLWINPADADNLWLEFRERHVG